MILEIKLRIPKVNRNDRALVTRDLDAVSYFERSIEQDEDAGKKIGNRIFQGETYGETRQPETCHQRGNIDP